MLKMRLEIYAESQAIMTCGERLGSLTAMGFNLILSVNLQALPAFPALQACSDPIPNLAPSCLCPSAPPPTVLQPASPASHAALLTLLNPDLLEPF